MSAPTIPSATEPATRWFRALAVAEVAVPGLFVWAVTVVPAAGGRFSTLAWISAAGAVVALVSGSVVATFRPRLGVALGIWAFLLLSLLTWCLHPTALRVDQLDPVRATAGTFGWLLFALGWGKPRTVGVHPEDHPRARLHLHLAPRRRPSMRAVGVVGCATAAAVSYLAFAWHVRETGRALLVHGVALACAIVVVTASASVALLGREVSVVPSAKQRIRRALPWFLVLGALLAIGVAWWLARERAQGPGQTGHTDLRGARAHAFDLKPSRTLSVSSLESRSSSARRVTAASR